MRVPVALHSHQLVVSSIFLIFPNWWICNAMMYFFIVWGQSDASNKGAPTLLILNLQRMGESCSCHPGDSHKNQGQAHLHPSSMWSVSPFRVTWELEKRNSQAPCLRISSTSGMGSVVYICMKVPQVTLLYSQFVTPWPRASDRVLAEETGKWHVQ